MTPEPGDVVRFTPGVIGTIAREVATGGNVLETGGILLGHGRQSFTVTAAGGPGPRAVHQTRFFLRDLEHAQGLAAKAWKEDESQWIGDWHTHPNGPPYPSPTDLRAIVEVLHDPVLRLESFLVVVIARQDDVDWALHAWRVRLLDERTQVDVLAVETDELRGADPPLDDS